MRERRGQSGHTCKAGELLSSYLYTLSGLYLVFLIRLEFGEGRQNGNTAGRVSELLILKLRGRDIATKGRKIGRKGPEGGSV